MKDAAERLDKFISERGMLSRREIKALCRAGRVTVNGTAVADSAFKILPSQDAVCVEGKPVPMEKHLYVMMNKPAGVISASRDKHAQTALDLLPEGFRRKGLFPAGRLDKDTEGFLLITDDGDFAHRILSPKRHVPKTYRAMVAGGVTPDVERAFAAGVTLEDGERCLGASLRVLGRGGLTETEVVLFEGMYHQIKRMFACCGCEVRALKRVAIGGLWLDAGLAPGESREILDKEVDKILSWETARCPQKEPKSQ